MGNYQDMTIPIRAAQQPSHRPRRSGAVLVWCAFLLTVLLGMVGLVIDGGLMLAAHRHAHNAADAAVMAAAIERVMGGSDAEVIAVAQTYVNDTGRNDLPNATVTVNIPPSQGAYLGSANYIEVLVNSPIPTYFIHVLPQLNRGQTVNARAVAGFEMVVAGDGAIALDPKAWPALDVSGGGALRVEGRVIVNSEGGGVDEDGNPSNMQQIGHNRWAAKAGQPNSDDGIYASDIHVVGGVDKPEYFKHIDPLNPNSPLRCNQLPMPDPLALLVTPTVANGVITSNWGAVKVSNSGLQEGPAGWEDPVTGEVTMQPGVFESIEITGGTVTMAPGIYVLSPPPRVNNALKLTGGQVIGNGVMFYNTGDDYNAVSGSPDAADPPDPINLQPPPHKSRTNFGGVTINASMQFTPIDTSQYNYPTPDIDAFNGVLFYQRRMNRETIQIEGNSGQGNLAGTIYAKWAHFTLAGQGTYDARFVVGSMDVTGQGDVTLRYTGQNVARAAQVFLVE